MGKPSGGGGKSPFNLSKNGVDSVSRELWVDLGLIPNGQQYQIGIATFTPIDKTIKMEIRTNNTGKSTGTDQDTTLLGSGSTRAGETKTIDLWKRGRLYITTVLSTGVEHWWLKFTSKQATFSDVIWSITYLELN